MADHNEETPNRPQGEERGQRETRARKAGSRFGEETGDAVRDGLSETTEVIQREPPNLATAALIGTAVAIVEPELIPGLLIGVGVTLVPKLLPAVGTLLRPFVKAVVTTGYELTSGVRQLAAEAREQVEDMVAEAQAEREQRLRRQPPEMEASETGRRPRRAQQPQPQSA